MVSPFENVVEKKAGEIKSNLVCWANDLELGLKVLRALIKSGATPRRYNQIFRKAPGCARVQQGDGVTPVGISESPGERTHSPFPRG